MEYQPDWKSKVLVALFGKKRLMTLLDTGELMFKEDFKVTAEFKSISKHIIYAAIGANLTAIITSILLARTVFIKSSFCSPAKLLTDCSLVFISYYLAAIFLS
jgi:hypothetical protein